MRKMYFINNLSKKREKNTVSSLKLFICEVLLINSFIKYSKVKKKTCRHVEKAR